MNTRPAVYIIFAMSIGVLIGTIFGPTILENPSSFSLGVFIGTIYSPIVGNTASVYSLGAMGITLSGVLLGLLIATAVRAKSV